MTYYVLSRMGSSTAMESDNRSFCGLQNHVAHSRCIPRSSSQGRFAPIIKFIAHVVTSGDTLGAFSTVLMQCTYQERSLTTSRLSTSNLCRLFSKLAVCAERVDV
ncbi:hypothetical protein BDY19DRAFT_901392 [Irpex rosettiformis]|uniref:Uncharacterized protein n=1 Tax=Irpex rosettiformis TaxID=378272 RepID=A0ACB8UIJ6_9APHY|nr:hypothetical protein BDY19DRAFT_901392 [Irpex rosettiformis]